MLLDVLVALAVAALFIGVLAQVLASAWQGHKRPMERVAALNIARSIASQASSDNGRFRGDGQVGRFAYRTEIAPLVIEARESGLAPAPDRLEAMEKLRAADVGGARPQQMTIFVRGPSGRRLSFEAIRLDAPR
ncbi:hypothetical protein [Tardiphaga sp.]|uniref:hypothetical protein n=1 Tax=Tardiphaga sp. TaxID=1926292 RepID=UPI00352BA507